MNQVLTEPTRVTPISKTLIDVVITNSKESLSHIGVYPLSISDHYLIYAIPGVDQSLLKQEILSILTNQNSKRISLISLGRVLIIFKT